MPNIIFAVCAECRCEPAEPQKSSDPSKRHLSPVPHSPSYVTSPAISLLNFFHSPNSSSKLLDLSPRNFAAS